MKSILQFSPLLLFIMLYEVALAWVNCMKSKSVTIRMKATKQYFFVVLIIMLVQDDSCISVHGWKPSVSSPQMS